MQLDQNSELIPDQEALSPRVESVALSGTDNYLHHGFVLSPCFGQFGDLLQLLLHPLLRCLISRQRSHRSQDFFSARRRGMELFSIFLHSERHLFLLPDGAVFFI